MLCLFDSGHIGMLGLGTTAFVSLGLGIHLAYFVGVALHVVAEDGCASSWKGDIETKLVKQMLRQSQSI